MISYDVPTKQWCNAPDLDLSVDDLKTYLTAQIEQHAVDLRAMYIGNTSPAEMASWTLKVAEAVKYNATQVATDAPMLTLEATARGIDLQQLVDKVVYKASLMSQLEAVVSGNAGRHTDAIKQLTDIQQLYAYDWSTGWPL